MKKWQRDLLGWTKYDKYKSLRSDEPCGHLGCLSHISHPCEECGRTGGKFIEYEKLKRDYYELIMAVGNKHEGETRHETALRYILEAEQGSGTAQEKRDHVGC